MIFARWSDIFGRRSTYLVALLIFTVFSLGCHKLRGLSHGGLRLNLKGGTGLENENAARWSFSGVTSLAGEMFLLGEIILHFASDCLRSTLLCQLPWLENEARAFVSYLISFRLLLPAGAR